MRLHVYDIRGRRVATLVNGVQKPGRYTAVWDGRDMTGLGPSGVYFYRIETDRFTSQQDDAGEVIAAPPPHTEVLVGRAEQHEGSGSARRPHRFAAPEPEHRVEEVTEVRS